MKKRGRPPGYKRDTSSWYPMFFSQIGAGVTKRIRKEKFDELSKAYEVKKVDDTPTMITYEGTTEDGAVITLKRVDNGRSHATR